MCCRYTPPSKRPLSSKIVAKSAAICFRLRTKMGGASGAGCLLRCFCVEQEAACSRAPAAIVPGQEPESRDAGVSRSGESGSHLAAASVTDAAGTHVAVVAAVRCTTTVSGGR